MEFATATTWFSRVQRTMREGGRSALQSSIVAPIWACRNPINNFSIRLIRLQPITFCLPQALFQHFTFKLFHFWVCLFSYFGRQKGKEGSPPSTISLSSLRFHFSAAGSVLHHSRLLPGRARQRNKRNLPFPASNNGPRIISKRSQHQRFSFTPTDHLAKIHISNIKIITTYKLW